MSRTIKIRLLIAILGVVTAVTASLTFFGDSVPSRWIWVGLGIAAVVITGILLIIESSRSRTRDSNEPTE